MRAEHPNDAPRRESTGFLPWGRSRTTPALRVYSIVGLVLMLIDVVFIVLVSVGADSPWQVAVGLVLGPLYLLGFIPVGIISGRQNLDAIVRRVEQEELEEAERERVTG